MGLNRFWNAQVNTGTLKMAIFGPELSFLAASISLKMPSLKRHSDVDAFQTLRKWCLKAVLFISLALSALAL